MINLRIILFPTLFLTVLALQQDGHKYRMFITQRCALPDSLLGNNVREEFSDYDENAPLRSFSIDLNEDGNKEYFVVSDALCGSSNCTWVIYDLKGYRSIGTFDAAIIYISRTKSSGFPILEAYNKVGGDQSIVSFFTFRKGTYRFRKRVELIENDIDNYFTNKPPINKECDELK